MESQSVDKETETGPVLLRDLPVRKPQETKLKRASERRTMPGVRVASDQVNAGFQRCHEDARHGPASSQLRPSSGSLPGLLQEPQALSVLMAAPLPSVSFSHCLAQQREKLGHVPVLRGLTSL